MRKYERKVAVHEILSSTDDDWMYNRNAVGPGADALDAPATLTEARQIATDARENGVDPTTSAIWLERALSVILATK